MKQIERMQENGRRLEGKFIIGIDPAKSKHQAVVLTPEGTTAGRSFSFPTSHTGFFEILPQRIEERTDENSQVVYAIEVSCSLWQNLAHQLQAQGKDVVLVSPLSTYHARASMTGDFSRTDTKDAELIARLARQGSYRDMADHTDHERALHRLGICYSKLRKSLQRHYLRLRSLVERTFPEFLQVLDLDTKSARYLLSLAITPAEFLALDMERVLPGLLQASRHQHGRQTITKLQVLARHSIGQAMGRELLRVERRICDGWLAMIETIEEQMADLTKQLVEAASQGPHFSVLTSLRGISDTMAALYLAELRSPERFRHWKQIEKFAGYNLYVSESGQYRGRRRISHLGGARLRWILYQMASETSKYVPEVRIKYLERRLEYGGSRNKHLVATIPQLLQLLWALMREQRPYQERPEAVAELKAVEARYQALQRRRHERRSQGTRAKAA